jgi:hypothetical protein
MDDLTGGRNGRDAPWQLAANECAEALNIDWYQTRFARKVGGAGAVSTTFSSGGPFTGVISSLIRHVPSVDATSAELWAMDGAATPVIGRLAGAATWTAPSIQDAPTGNGWDFHGASINGKLALAYKSATARLHGWDGSTVRRFGLPQAGVHTVVDSGGGAYPAILRYYRLRWTTQVAGITTRRSEPNASVAFTPSGANGSAQISRPTGASEGETHWEVEASSDNAIFYRIATVVIATTTYNDSADPATYSASPLSALTGVYTLQKPYKFVATDQNRLLGLGSWTATDKQNRLEISAVIGSLNVSDEERVDTTTNYYLDFDEASAGQAIGLAGPVFGSFFVFFESQIWQLTPTGVVTAPYRAEAISKTIGAIAQKSIILGEDADGNPALYWMSARGPYRWSLKGLEYLGHNVEDLILGVVTGITPAISITKLAVAGTASILCHGVYYADLHQVWFWYATTVDTFPTVIIKYHIDGGGWSRDNRNATNARCSCMFATTVGATMSRDLKPYIGYAITNTTIWKLETGTDDAGSAFQGELTLRAIEPGGPGYVGEVGDPELCGSAALLAGSAVTITLSMDFNANILTTVSLNSTSTEWRVLVQADGIARSNIRFAQYKIQATEQFVMDRLTVPIGRHGKSTS